MSAEGKEVLLTEANSAAIVFALRTIADQVERGGCQKFRGNLEIDHENVTTKIDVGVGTAMVLLTHSNIRIYGDLTLINEHNPAKVIS